MAAILMGRTLYQSSFVVAANAHNPSILNHDWLIRNGVIPPEGWELSAPPIVTPPVATLEYKVGIGLVLETNKLTINCSPRGDAVSPDQLKTASSVAIRYVETLTHVPYSGVGNNFSVAVDCKDANAELVRWFGGTGPWTEGLGSVRTKLVYQLEDCVRNVELSAGSRTVNRDGAIVEEEIISFSSNYHRDADSWEQVISVLERYESDYEDFSAFVEEAEKVIRG